MKIDAVLIAGPTASGKSDAALALAERCNGIVINTDSMQVYREAPILTAAPDAAAQARVPHLLYGHVAARDGYSVGRWTDDARAALDETRARGKLPIFVGGTGLYFMALTEGLAAIPPTPPDIRAAARGLMEAIGPQEFHRLLAARDPKTAAGLRPTDPQRLLRAHEVFTATGRPLVDWQAEPAAPLLHGRTLAKFVADPPRPVLHARIAARFARMVANGALAEALGLKNLDPALPAAKLLGLRPLIALAEGRLDSASALADAVTATRQFAKRQMTWFRHRMSDHVWFDPEKSNIVAMFDGFVA